MTGGIRPDEKRMLADAGLRHGSWTEDVEPIVLARGAENTTFALDGWIIRRSGQPDAQAKEVALLGALAEAVTVPVPVPVLHEPDHGLFAYRRLPGTPLLHAPGWSAPSVESGLVEVLGALSTLDAAHRLPPDLYPNEDWHRDAADGFDRIRAHLSTAQTRLIRMFLDEEPPPTGEAVVPQHNDLGAEHILVDVRGDLCGIIDWSDAALADPARDLGSIYRDLGPDAALRVGEELGRPVADDDADRIRFHARCRWIEDVSFGLQDPETRRAYLANAQRTFAHTFRSVR